MKKLNTSKILCMLTLVLVLALGQFISITQVHAAEGDPVVKIENSGSRLNVNIKNITNPSYQWEISTTESGTYSPISGATAKHYDITATDEGKYIRLKVGDMTSAPTGPIGKLVVFDLAKGKVELDSTYTGKDSSGETVTGTHVASNIYVITQGNHEVMTTNSILFKGNHSSAPFDVTLAGVNMGENPTNHNQGEGVSGSNTPSGGKIQIPANSGNTKKVTLRLKGENIVRYICYYNGTDTITPTTTSSYLKITDINGDGASDGGELYIPIKLKANEIDDFVKTKTNYNHWNAGIGGTDSNSLVQNLTIAGGKIQVATTLGDNCTAIGAGGNGYCQMEISGGEVFAHCNGTGAAIGGGIGWNAQGGTANVLISGGKVYAKNHGHIETTKDGVKATVGGVAIGSGSSFFAKGTDGEVRITGGTVEAYGTYGNGIGGGNSSSSTGGSAEITISGGKVKATSIGGGDSKTGVGGSATVNISNPANVTLEKGIGGGSSLSGAGGAATINVYGGTMIAGGVIGGGNGGASGTGGEATVNVTGGTLKSASIGGGVGGASGAGGAAKIEISGGNIETGSIGGGDTLDTSENKKLGYATANISGGTISGQFLMAAGGSQPCSFIMSGGRLYGVNTTDTSKYTYAQKNGAAVYMDDPNGKVEITGGVIEDCSANNGGAIYMTAGTFTMSQARADVETAIRNCEATGNGGAVYLGGGSVTVTGGSINNNEAGLNGGAVYVNGGNVRVEGGNISQNKTAENGGAVAINNGNYTMVGGTVSGNTAVNGAGGGIYIAAETEAVNANVFSGTISNNRSNSHGGAVAVVGKTDENAKPITVTVGVNKVHYDQEGDRITCNHSDVTTLNRETCPILSGNATNGSGGAIYLTGNYDSRLNLYCCEEDSEHESYAGLDNGQSNFMKVEGGRVIITASENMTNESSQDAMHGNVKISSTVYITGGQVDLWGDMRNPSFEDIVTVDITKEGDYFNDHRAFDAYYKLIYYENFKDSETGQVTGQYKETSVKHNDTEVISANIYEHPGYKIVGWNTNANGTDENGWYYPGREYLFDGTETGNLTIYAIWEPHGYDVVFNPNVPEGEEFSGKMENQSLTYDAFEKLTPNAYKRPGYIFSGWNTEADGSGATTYSDNAEVKNLTTKVGVPVELFAVWTECMHDNVHEYSYSLIDDGKTLKRTCSCEGYSETASLAAEDTVYNKQAHPATVNYSEGNWTGEIVTYTGDGITLDSPPINAGTYTASITAGGKTASVTYTIDKADQSAPNKPEYEVSGANKDTINIKPVELKITDDPTYDSKVLYKVVYYNGAQMVTMSKEVDPDAVLIEDKYAAVFELGVALTNYYVYVSYTEGTNYKASNERMADGVYWFAGDVKVIVNSGEGIIHSLDVATADSNLTGIAVTLKLEQGYYLPSNHTVTIETRKLDEQNTIISPGATISGKELEYSISSIPKSCLIKINITDAKKIPTATANIKAGEEFGTVSESNAVISRNSAVTAYFELKDYDEHAYSGIALGFNENLPTETTVIMVDKSSNLNIYYSYIVGNDSKEIQLAEFKKMGGANTNKYQLTSGDKKLQFIVDFSDVENSKLIGKDTELKMTLSLEGNSNGAPDLSNTFVVASQLKEQGSFEMVAVDFAKSIDLKLDYTKSEGKESKWNNRHASLVLVPVTQTTDPMHKKIPQDARIVCYDGESTRVINRSRNGAFIVPLEGINDEEFTLTLESFALMPNTTYKMNAYWLISDTIVGGSPMNGQLVSNIEIQFKTGLMKTPSVEIIPIDDSGNHISKDDRLYSSNEELRVNVNWLNIEPDDLVTVDLLMKGTTGEYVETAVRSNNLNGGLSDGIETFTTGLNLTVNDAEKYHSYCLRVRIMDGLIKTTETNYYFIVEKAGVQNTAE